jgi:hypothetical protein
MKLLCASNSIAFAQSLKIALEGDGIETFCSDPDFALGSIAGQVAGGGGRVYVLHEPDWERAIEILQQLSPPQEAIPRPMGQKRRVPRWMIMVLTALGTALLMLLLGGR